MIQDIYPSRFFNEYRPEARWKEDSPVLCFHDRTILVHSGDDVGQIRLPAVSQLRNIRAGERAGGCREDCSVQERAEDDFSERLIYAFAVDGQEYFLDRGNDCYELPGFSYIDISTVRRYAGNVAGMIVFTGNHLHQWYRESCFCGCCGARTIPDTQERAMLCPACGKKIYPRLNPAVIVGVLHGEELLVTKYKTGFGHYALVAGFAEIGETLEETVAREVKEETGLRVKNIRYYKSQPWGIAKDLLAGFYCEVDGDPTIYMDEQELKLAQWRRRDEIELQPDSYSLTNEMMKRFKEGKEPRFYDYYFFDLDGTLTDPGIGITNSVMYALAKYQITVGDRSELYRFIGPPLKDSFMNFYGFTQEQAQKAVDDYREYFRDRGMLENQVYEDIPAVLDTLKRRGKKLVVATSKPEEFSVTILKHFGLYGYFDFIAAATMDGSRSKKKDVIAHAVNRLEISDRSRILMIGDRDQDICGAKENGIDSAGVLYGYGSKEELCGAGADYIVETPLGLLDI